MNTPNSIYIRHPEIIAREIVDEFILVPISNELMEMHSFFTLNSVGRFIWEHLDGVNDLKTISNAITTAYEIKTETAQKDLYQLITELQEAGLISCVSNRGDD